MQKFKRFLRLFLFLLLIGMASILPIPIVYYGKDNLPKNLTELVEKNTDDDDNEDIKKLF